MREHIIFFICVLIICGTTAKPSQTSFVVSSTEPSKENENKDTSVTSFPIIYEMDIAANISNRFAKTLVISKVKNNDKIAKETTFTVVLPEKAFISEFVMEIGGKSYKAYVKEKEEAKNIYNQAVASGQSAAHVSVSARDSNRFTVSVNIEPESKAAFLLTYEELLQRKNNQYELVLNIHPGQIVKRLNVEVLINETRPLKFVKTPSLRSGNEISKNEDKLDPSSDIQIINSTTAVVKFNPDSDQQKQFARDLGTKESNGLSGQFVVQYDVERDPLGGEVLLQDGYFVHFFAPSDLKPLPKHVVFVLDTSGSMGGRRMSQLKDAMKSILDEIKKGDLISIVEFGNDIKVWDVTFEHKRTIQMIRDPEESLSILSELDLPSPILVDDEVIENSKKAIEKLEEYGGTNMIDGLNTGLYLVKLGQERNANKTDKNYQPIMIFLTDGEPNGGVVSSTHGITELVTRLNSKNNNVPIFSLSFGDGADKQFLRQLSSKNLGFSRHIYEASDASLQLQEFYKQISSPLLSNIIFKYESEVKEVTKAHFPIFFEGSELVIAGRYKDPSFPSVVSCKGPVGPITLRPKIETPVTSLERLWAYLTVKQTLDERNSVENKTHLTKKALDLATKYSFVTDVTSLVVVKPNDTSNVNTEEAAASSKNPIYQSTPLTLGFARPMAAFSPRGGGYSSYHGSSHRSFHASHTFLRFGGGGPNPYPSRFYASSFSTTTQSSLRATSTKIPIPKSTTVTSTSTSTQTSTSTATSTATSTSTSTSTLPSTSTATSTTTSTTTEKPNLGNTLSWLVPVLNANGTLTISQIAYELGENTSIIATLECPKIPVNSTDVGICTLLKDCPEIHTYLTDFQVYQQYFCPINNKYAGVCCPKKPKLL